MTSKESLVLKYVFDLIAEKIGDDPEKLFAAARKDFPSLNVTINVINVEKVGNVIQSEDNSGIISGSTTRDSRADQTELTSTTRRLLESLKQLLIDVPETKREEVALATDTFIAAAYGDKELSHSELENTINKVAEGAPSLRKKLNEIATGATGSLLAEAVLQALRRFSV